MKFVAAIFMLVDHIGMLFFPTQVIWRLIGRLAMPLFAYSVAMGFKYTSSLKRYILRMTFFALVSQIPYVWLIRQTGGRGLSLNIGFTFLAALMILYLLEGALDKSDWRKNGYYLCIIGICYIANFLKMDYGCYGILTVVLFYEFGLKTGQLKSAYLYFVLLNLIWSTLLQNPLQIFAILAVFIIEPLEQIKWRGKRAFFYVFYPLHMIILCWIKSLI